MLSIGLKNAILALLIILILHVLIKNAIPTSFVCLGNNYSKDSFDVFYKDKIIKNADQISFINLGNGYAKDNFNNYYNGKKII